MKKLTAFVLALALCLSLCTVTAFATGTSYAITNGTPESAKETNHGSISIDKTTAAEGDTVTVTVNPADGYQLKSLTATPVAPTISTIADVLATVEGGFPTSSEKAWLGSEPLNCCYIAGNDLKIGGLKATFLDLTTDVNVGVGGDSFTYSDSNGTFTFNMTEGKLTSIKVKESGFFDGTYAPASTPSARLKPITPAKQTDGTYTFTMPDYAVTVTAVFEKKAITIADVIATYENFPLTKDTDLYWTNEQGTTCYYFNNNLFFRYTSTKSLMQSMTVSVAADGKNYTYSDGTVTYTFIMDNSGVLAAITVSGSTDIKYNGTYGAPPTKYTVTNGTTDMNGNIAIDKASAAEGETVTITVTPAEGYQLKKLTVLSTISLAPPITPAQDASDKTKYTFKMPSYPVRVTAEFEEKAITIADILPDDFPTCVDVLPPNVWVNNNGVYMMVLPYSIEIFTLDEYGNPDYVELVNDIRTATLTKNGNNYTYTNNVVTTTTNNVVTTTFLMSDNGLESVKIEGLTGEYVDFNGTYGAQHAHSFTYTVNGGKLTATCAEGCDKGYDTTPLTLTLTAPASLVYDGNAKVFTFADGEAAAWTGAGLELPTFEYYLDKPETSWLDGLDGDPIAAAEGYVVMIRVGVKAAKVEFNIDKATPYIKTTPAPNDIEYGEKLSDSTLFGGYVQVSSTNTTQVGGLFEWTNPDTVPGLDDSEVTEYDVTFTPADTDNFNTVSCKVKIKVTHTHNPVKVTGQAATKTASGWKDYYECACGALFADENGTTPIENLDTWKAAGGTGYVPPLAPESYTVTFNMNGHGTQIDPQTVEEGNKATKPNDPTAADYTFGGWYRDAGCTQAWNFGTDKVKANTTLYAKWIADAVQKAAIRGNVKEDGSNVIGATVELFLGTEKVAATVTKDDPAGEYSFDNVENGVYNIVVTKTDGKTKTELVTVNTANTFAKDVELPTSDVSSQVEHKGNEVSGAKSDISQTVVGGLDVAAAANAEVSKKVVVKLTVEPKADTNTPAQTSIKNLPEASGKKVEFLDLSLTKTVDGAEIPNFGDTNTQLLTIVIPFDFTGVDVRSVMILRNHGGNTEKLTGTANANGEYFKADEQAGTLTIFAKKFSTYAMAYAEQSTGGHGGGSYTPGHTVTSDLKNVTKVTIDGKVVDSRYYTVSGGNVTLTDAFMKTLANGKHTVKLYNGDVAATGTMTVSGNAAVVSAKTADAGIALYGVLSVSS